MVLLIDAAVGIVLLNVPRSAALVLTVLVLVFSKAAAEDIVLELVDCKAALVGIVSEPEN